MFKVVSKINFSFSFDSELLLIKDKSYDVISTGCISGNRLAYWVVAEDDEKRIFEVSDFYTEYELRNIKLKRINSKNIC